MDSETEEGRAFRNSAAEKDPGEVRTRTEAEVLLLWRTGEEQPSSTSAGQVFVMLVSFCLNAKGSQILDTTERSHNVSQLRHYCSS